jgi:hypothetical protein
MTFFVTHYLIKILYPAFLFLSIKNLFLTYFDFSVVVDGSFLVVHTFIGHVSKYFIAYNPVVITIILGLPVVISSVKERRKEKHEREMKGRK